MHLTRTSLMAGTLLCFCSSVLWWESADASNLPSSIGESTLQQHCNLCRPPSITETAPPTTLQPYRRQPPPRPPGSRPHRLPKSHYKLTPSHKQAARSSQERLFGRRLPAGQSIYTIDGDTIRIGTDRIRLRGIDTPELDEPGGDAARQRLEQLLRAGSIRIVPHGQDVYGRTVADVFVDDRNVAEILDQEGHAKPRS